MLGCHLSEVGEFDYKAQFSSQVALSCRECFHFDGGLTFEMPVLEILYGSKLIFIYQLT